MKKSLFKGRALSAALFVLLLSIAGMKNALAQTQMATLQHNDSITGVFYGENAFSSAYNAAVSGDVIMLSSGTYGAISPFNKPITVRGAGCVFDTLTNVLPTIIPGSFSIFSNNVSFEGIIFSGIINIYNGIPVSNISFVKCNINQIGGGTTTTRKMFCHYNNCIIKNYSSHYFTGTSINNSVIRFTEYSQNDIYNPTNIYNSVIVFDSILPINNIVAYNSIIATSSGHNVSNNTFFNCINIKTGETSLFEDQLNTSNMEMDNYSDVFETFDGTISYENIYQLKNDIATGFLGHDGTEVGIFGGMMPYNPRPSYMIMKHFKVAPRSTVDGKLSVVIEIIAEDE